jgi:hypothetical protein
MFSVGDGVGTRGLGAGWLTERDGLNRKGSNG